MNRQLLSLALCSLVFVGCANPVNRHTASKYANAAIAAREAGNWRLARLNWSRAIPNAEVGGAPKRALAIAYYEYGRASGIVCEWTDAQQGLTKSLEIDRGIGGPIHLPLIELGRLDLDQRKYAEARQYFQEANAIFTRENAETLDPLGYAEFLDEYAVAIENSASNEDASRFRARAEQLRSTFPNGKKHSERTPYGTQCGAP